jgi:hypothetical protein
MKRQLITTLLSTALVLTPLGALATDQAPQQSDLTSGPGAGVQKAQLFDGGTTTYVVGGLLAAGLIVVAVSGGGGGHAAATTSTSH